ncbi:MAG: hypothetical protein WDN24_21710 [Sphingomonas sp.]
MRSGASPAEVALLPRRRPIGQLVKSLISGRTRDAVSLGAYRRLGKSFGSPARLAAAAPEAVRRTIADVTFAEAKAEWLVAALRRIGRERPTSRSTSRAACRSTRRSPGSSGCPASAARSPRRRSTQASSTGRC